jgi:hypothetical protein
MAKAKNFIQGAIKRPGQLHRDLGVPLGKKIPEAKIRAAAKRPGKVGERARFAETLDHLRPKGDAMKKHHEKKHEAKKEHEGKKREHEKKAEHHEKRRERHHEQKADHPTAHEHISHAQKAMDRVKGRLEY